MGCQNSKQEVKKFQKKMQDIDTAEHSSECADIIPEDIKHYERFFRYDYQRSKKRHEIQKQQQKLRSMHNLDLHQEELNLKSMHSL